MHSANVAMLGSALGSVHNPIPMSSALEIAEMAAHGAGRAPTT